MCIRKRQVRKERKKNKIKNISKVQLLLKEESDSSMNEPFTFMRKTFIRKIDFPSILILFL